MKNLLLILSIMCAFIATSAYARDRDGYGRRYKTTYSSFDRGFNRQYGYREVDERCRYNTCLETTFRTTDIVYVEETVIYDSTYGEQRMVRVYETERYETHVVTYYVHNEAGRHHVRARRYNEHHRHYHGGYYYYTPYIMPGLVLTLDMMNSFDAQSAQLLVLGGIVFDFGLNVATSCRTQECMEAAGDIALLGIASSVFASVSNELNKAKNKTDLEKQIRAAEKDSADNI